MRVDRLASERANKQESKEVRKEAGKHGNK